MLFVFAITFVFAFGRVPQSQRNSQRGQSHDGKSNPIEEVGRETFVEFVQIDNTTLTGFRADGQLQL